MLEPKFPGQKSILVASFILSIFLGTNVQTIFAAESSCVTCHLNQEMLKENITAQKKTKSAMQSGAG